MAGKGKIVPLNELTKEWWAEENKKWYEQQRVLCAREDATAGTVPLWPHNYIVSVWADVTTGQRIEREYDINAGSQWEAMIFARRRIRGEAMRDGMWVKQMGEAVGIISLVKVPKIGEPEPDF